jgi:hypothetical protein
MEKFFAYTLPFVLGFCLSIMAQSLFQPGSGTGGSPIGGSNTKWTVMP